MQEINEGYPGNGYEWLWNPKCPLQNISEGIA